MARLTRRLLRDDNGNVAIVFGLAAVVLMVSVGAGLDLMRANQARQKLSEVAALTCQYASRPSVVQMASTSYVVPNGGPTYQSAVTGYLNTVLTSEKVGWTQTNATPFTYAVNGAADVNVAARVPTTLMQVVGVSTVPVAATSHCYDSPSTIPQTTPGSLLVKEGFEATDGSDVTYYQLPGRSYATPSAFVATAGYTGATGSSWSLTGYCLETDVVGTISTTVPEGSRSAELDCENGAHGAGNSSISRKVYLPTGNYELRYNYRSRVDYPNYTPGYVCASAASDLAWANDTRSVGGPVANALRTNQMNVYLDLDANGAPPTHITLVGGTTLAGANLIDQCVYSQTWIERSVRIFVTSAGNYWLSFAADGTNDSFGAQLDNIRLCNETCAGTLNNNFPSTWLAANNGGVNKQLFRETFESPTYFGPGYSETVNANSHTGTSGTAASGWPGETARGWAIGPYNQLEANLGAAAQGTQSMELDASKNGAILTANRHIARYFILDPGYYQVDYAYVSRTAFTGMTGFTCTNAPASSTALSGYPDNTTAYATLRGTGGGGTFAKDTSNFALFMANGQLVSTPNNSDTLNAPTLYTNPDGATSLVPSVPPTALSFTNYNTAQVNPVLDFCGYAANWQNRSATVKIQKPGKYWVFFTALGTDDNHGAMVDDIRFTAIGTPYTAAPSNAVAIPVADPQPTSRITYSGFYIVSNPFTPPAALQ